MRCSLCITVEYGYSRKEISEGYQEGFRIGVVFSLRNLNEKYDIDERTGNGSTRIPESEREGYAKELIME